MRLTELNLVTGNGHGEVPVEPRASQGDIQQPPRTVTCHRDRDAASHSFDKVDRSREGFDPFEQFFADPGEEFIDQRGSVARSAEVFGHELA